MLLLIMVPGTNLANAALDTLLPFSLPSLPPLPKQHIGNAQQPKQQPIQRQNMRCQPPKNPINQLIRSG